MSRPSRRLSLRAIIFAATLGLCGTLLVPHSATADIPGLKVSPLHYQDELTPGRVKTGFIEISNPSDGPLNIATSVKGFRQTGTDGQLEFFDDPELSAGIKVDFTEFELGPREAIRIHFSVDSGKLPAGGIYAAVFFRTVPPASASDSSYVSESANIGTILELTNGPGGPRQGQITQLNLPFWQFGSALKGSLDYQNTDRSVHPVGFHPALTAAVTPWGKAPKLNTGLVLPGSTRHFEFARTGAYFGLLPVVFTDTDTNRVTTKWVFAVTGFYQWIVLVLLIVAAIILIARPRRITSLWQSRPRRRRPAPAPRPLPAEPIRAAKLMPKLDPEAQPPLTPVFLATILLRYGVTEFTYKHAPSGIENTTLMVDSKGEPLVLRIYSQAGHTRAGIETELDFMDLLAQSHIPVPAVRPDADGHRLGEITEDGHTWLYVVMELVPGSHPQGYTPELLAELATYQARIHQLGAQFAERHDHTPGPTELIETYGERIDRHKLSDPDMLAFLDRAQKFQVTLPAELPSGFMHLDLDNGNILVADGAISAILDFDDLTYAPYVMCLGFTLWDVLAETGDVDDVRHYLANYAHLRPLTAAELDHLPSVMLFRNYAIGTIDMMLGKLGTEDLAQILKTEQILLGLKPDMLK